MLDLDFYITSKTGQLNIRTCHSGRKKGNTILINVQIKVSKQETSV